MTLKFYCVWYWSFILWVFIIIFNFHLLYHIICMYNNPQNHRLKSSLIFLKYTPIIDFHPRHSFEAFRTLFSNVTQHVITQRIYKIRGKLYLCSWHSDKDFFWSENGSRRTLPRVLLRAKISGKQSNSY